MAETIRNGLHGFFTEITGLFIDMSPYLLLGMIMVAVLKLFFNKNIVRHHLGGGGVWPLIKAALLGVPLPLCSCGVIPTAVYMKSSGASKPSVLSFLISTPQTGADSIIATYGMMGPVFAVFRPLAAFVMGIFGGIAEAVTGRNSTDTISRSNDAVDGPKRWRQRVPFALKYAFGEFLDDIAIQFIIGLTAAALISLALPDNFFMTHTVLRSGILGMVLVILAGTPMYICATASIPIAVALLEKGISPGVAYVFLVVGPATNIASLSVLYKTLGKKTTAVYLAVIIAGGVFFGYGLNAVFTLLDRSPRLIHAAHTHSGDNSWFGVVTAVLLAGLLMMSIGRTINARWRGRRAAGGAAMKKNTITLRVNGMTCGHCAANVKSALAAVPGVTEAKVDLAAKRAEVSGDNIDRAQVRQAVRDAGYDPAPR